MSALSQKYRALFPVCERYVYLNNAAVAPPSRLAASASARWFEDALTHGVVNEGEWEQQSDRVRASCAALVGASSAEIAFVRNTSHGLGLIAEGLDWQPGDEVAVCTELEYPSNVYVWQHLARRGVVVRSITPARGGVTVEELARVLSPRTRLVATSSVQYATGHRTDLGAIGRLCRAKGILYCVDGIQSVGAEPIDVKRDCIDFLSADSHKWMLGLPGVGFLYVSEAALDRITPVLVGWKSTVGAWDFNESRFELRRDAAKLEEGSPTYAALFAMGASLELLLEAGLSQIQQSNAALLGALERRLRAAGCDVSPGPEERAGILTFALPTVASEVFHRIATDARIALSLRRGRLRVSPHFYNDESDLEALALLVEQHL